MAGGRGLTAMTTRRVLTVNAGSSSVRLDAFDLSDKGPTRIASLKADADGPTEALMARFLSEIGEPAPAAAIHRLVHGGPAITDPRLVDAAVERQIEATLRLAPLHNGRCLALIRAARVVLGAGAAEIVAPDTAFFAGLPEVARSYALPRGVASELGLRRFGFHGFAHQAMLEAWSAERTAAQRAADRVISLQLGSGCSIAAIRGGQPLDSSMGFSPLEGLVMATRAGDLDPGLLLHMLTEGGFETEQLAEMLNHQAGLLGLSGISGDMRELLAVATPEAEAAIALYCYRARKYVGAYLAVLGGADAILFGGGVGENAPAVRSAILSGLGFADVAINDAANRSAVGTTARIEGDRSQVAIMVMRVDESRAMLDAALHLLVKKPAN